jgi:hypothetical protein
MTGRRIVAWAILLAAAVVIGYVLLYELYLLWVLGP